MRSTCIHGYWNQCPIHKVWCLREASQIGQIVYYKTQHSRIPIDPAILAAIGDQKLDTFFGPKLIKISITISNHIFQKKLYACFELVYVFQDH